MCGGQGILGNIFGGVQGIANGVQANAVAKGNAKTVVSMSKVEAEKIRRQGERNASTARAMAAENGVDVDQGAAAKIQDEHISDAEYNASLVIQDGLNQASQLRQQGRAQRLNYGLNAASNLVGGIYKLSGWK